jgi:hypothetical protein
MEEGGPGNVDCTVRLQRRGQFMKVNKTAALAVIPAHQAASRKAS